MKSTRSTNKEKSRRLAGGCRALSQDSKLLGMPNTIELGLEPRRSRGSMLAGLAPILLLRDGDLRAAAALNRRCNASNSDLMSLGLFMLQKPCVVGEREVADSALLCLGF